VYVAVQNHTLTMITGFMGRVGKGAPLVLGGRDQSPPQSPIAELSAAAAGLKSIGHVPSPRVLVGIGQGVMQWRVTIGVLILR
jgi:hypothetical protein